MAHEKLFGICENKCMVEVPSLEKHNTDLQYFQEFTYVVDSDEALLNWANNVEGNDYTSVLIKKGAWTSTVGVNLTATNTKVVVGEAGSTLRFNDVEKALYYDAVPSTRPSQYHMFNVYVSHTITTNIDSYGFYNCKNLTNCTNVTNTSMLQSCGFYNCENLTNCFCYVTANLKQPSYGFYNCNNLINCKTGGGGTYSNGNYKYYGFYNCRGVSKCKANSKCATSVFENCYASQSENSTYAVADTANGGFNDTTNPSA